MDLAKIGFEIDTSNVKSAVEELRNLRDAALGVTKAFQSVKDSGEKSTDKASRKTKEMSSHVKAYEKSLDSANKAEEKNADTIEKTIELMRLRRNELAQGAKSSEAATIAMLRYKGATEDQVSELKKVFSEIQRIGGKNPFDSVIGEMRRLKDETNEYKNIVESSGKSVGLTAKELKEVAQIQEKINIIGKETGSTQDEINTKVKEATEEYKKQVQEKNKLKAQVEAIEKAEALAESRLRNQVTLSQKIAENRRQAELINSGFSASTAKTITSLESQGYNISEIRQFIAAEKDLAKAKGETVRAQKAVTTSVEQFADAHVMAFKKAQASAETYSKKSLEAVKRQLEQVKAEAELAAQGLSRTTALGVVRLQNRGASQSDIDTFIQTRKEIEAISAASKKATPLTLGLATVIRQIAPAAGALGVVSLLVQMGLAAVDTSDKLTQLKSRISLATEGTADFSKEFDNLLRIANESRTSIQDVGTLYSRLIPVVDKLGGSTLEAAAITESFSKLLLIGGSNTREASAAIVQFSQALGKGKLDGDEFRSIAEATPEVLRILEDSLGKTRGELFEMSKEGKLTADILGNVLINSLESLDAKLLGVPLTVGQSVQLIKNNLVETVKIFEEGTGSIGKLSDVFKDIATSIYDFNQSLKAGEYDKTIDNLILFDKILGSAVLGLIAARTAMSLFTAATGGASAAMTAFNFIVGANPLIRIASVVGASIAIFVGLRDEVFKVGDSFVSLSSVIEAFFESIGLSYKRLASIKDGVVSFFDDLNKAAKFLYGSNRELDKSIKDIEKSTGQSILQRAEQIRQEKELMELLDESVAQHKREEKAREDAAKRRATLKELTVQSAAAFDDETTSLVKVTERVNELKNKLDAVGKSELELAKAKSASVLATAQLIEAEGIRLLMQEGTSKAQEDQMNDFFARADKLREEAKLILDLAKAEGNLKSSRSESSRSSSGGAISSFNDKLRSQIETLTEELKLKRDLREEEELLQKAKEISNGKISQETKSLLDRVSALIQEKRLNEENNKELDALFEGYTKMAQSKNKVFEESEKLTSEYEKELESVEKQILVLGKNKEALLDLEQAKIDDAIATTKQNIANVQGIPGMEQQIEEYEKQIKVLEDLKDAKNRLARAEDKAAFDKEIEKIADDVGKGIADAIVKGGKTGTKSLGEFIKSYFKTLAIRLTIEPVIKNIASDLANQFKSLLSGGSLNFGNIASGIGSLSAALTGGTFGAGLSSLLKNQDLVLKSSFGLAKAFNYGEEAAAAFANSVNGFAGKIAPYAGSIAQLFGGNIKGAAGSALGTFIGGSFGGPIGAAIGSVIGDKIVGKIFGGGGGSKQEGGFGVAFTGNGAFNAYTKQLNDDVVKQYTDLVKQLGGTAKTLLTYSFIGTDPRGSAATQLGFGATLDGQNIYDRGRFGRGGENVGRSNEALQAELEEVTLRALVAALQNTDLARNISDLFNSIDLRAASLDEIKSALGDATLLKQVNEQFIKMGGALGTLSRVSLNSLKSFLSLAGGIEGLAQLQSSYIESIYTEEEKLAIKTKNLTDAFVSLGISVPATTKDYKNLVDNLDLSSEKGQELYVALLKLAPAFAELRGQVLDTFDVIIQSSLNSATKLIDDQIELSKQASSLAKETARSYFDAAKSLKEVSSSLVSSVSGNDQKVLEQQFRELLQKALSGDIDALQSVGAKGKELQEVLASNAKNKEELLYQTLVLKQQLDQAAAVADVLGVGADYQAKLFDVQTASFEVVKEQLLAGKLTTDILKEHTNLLKNIANQIVASSRLNVATTTDSTGKTVGALYDSNGKVIGQLSADTVLQLQANANQIAGQTTALNAGFNASTTTLNQGFVSSITGQTTAVTTGFNNSITGQTAQLGGLTQDQISSLQSLNTTQSRALGLTDIVAAATDGSETLLGAVLNRLNAQDSGTANIVTQLQSNTIEITNYLDKVVAAIRQQSEAQAAELKRQQDLAKAQSRLSEVASLREKAISEVSRAAGQINPTAASYGLTLNQANGAQASFGLDTNGLFQAMYDYITYNVGNEAGVSAFRSSFYSSGGLYDQTYGRAGELQGYLTELQAQRDLIKSLGGIPAFAKGGDYQGGMALVGEEGPELINFNSGGRVYTADQTRQMLSGSMQLASTNALLTTLCRKVEQLDSNNKSALYTIAKTQIQMKNFFDRMDDGDALAVRVQQETDETINVKVIP